MNHRRDSERRTSLKSDDEKVPNALDQSTAVSRSLTQIERVSRSDSEMNRLNWRSTRHAACDWRMLGSSGASWSDERMFTLVPHRQRRGQHGLLEPKEPPQQTESRPGSRVSFIASVEEEAGNIKDDRITRTNSRNDEADDYDTAPDALVLLLRVISYQIGLGGGWHVFRREAVELKRQIGDVKQLNVM